MEFILLLAIVFILLFGISLAKDTINLVDEINKNIREQIQLERQVQWEKLKQKDKQN
jgi:predicted PurR-regulated permease PerM